MPRRRRNPVKVTFNRVRGRAKARLVRQIADPGARRVVQTARKAKRVKRRIRRIL